MEEIRCRVGAAAVERSEDGGRLADQLGSPQPRTEVGTPVLSCAGGGSH